MKIAVLGGQGMLGHVATEILRADNEVVSFGRDMLDVEPSTLNMVGTKLSSLLGFDTDYVINCIGATKPVFRNSRDKINPIFINAVFPRQLATWCEFMGVKLIHITTDCVFSGLGKGNYTENDVHDALDDYGKSKSLGEPGNAMVLRTSIIGPENRGRKRHFLEWIKSQEGKTIRGFTNHHWNGLTTFELSHAISDIVDHNIWQQGTFHIFSDVVSKYQIVCDIVDAYGLNIEVEQFKTQDTIDRTLSTVEELNEFLSPANWTDMLDDLVNWENP